MRNFSKHIKDGPMTTFSNLKVLLFVSIIPLYMNKILLYLFCKDVIASLLKITKISDFL